MGSRPAARRPRDPLDRAELAVDGAAALAERFRLSQGFVGVSVLAVGTGLPELLVGVSGGIRHLQGVAVSGLGVGNATRSAIAQGALVLGVAGLVARLRLEPRMAWRDGLTLLFAVASARGSPPGWSRSSSRPGCWWIAPWRSPRTGGSVRT